MPSTPNTHQASPADMADRVFLGLVLWREARGEPRPCRVAVAHSILNRVARPSWWGHSVTEVLFKRWQYSSVTDPRDRQLTTWPQAGDQTWIDCLQIACAVLDGALANPAPGADSYHDTSIQPPKWTQPARFVGQLGRIRFYDVDHDYEATA